MELGCIKLDKVFKPNKNFQDFSENFLISVSTQKIVFFFCISKAQAGRKERRELLKMKFTFGDNDSDSASEKSNSFETETGDDERTTTSISPAVGRLVGQKADPSASSVEDPSARPSRPKKGPSVGSKAGPSTSQLVGPKADPSAVSSVDPKADPQAGTSEGPSAAKRLHFAELVGTS